MSEFFQVLLHGDGNVSVADGIVIDTASGAVFRTGTDRFPPESGAGQVTAQMRSALPIPRDSGVMFLGGSGRNLLLEGLAVVPTGVEDPGGIYMPDLNGKYAKGGYVIVEDIGSSLLMRGEVILAEATTSGTAAGSYVATEDGATLFGGAVTLVAAFETGTPLPVPSAFVTIHDGTAQGGVFAWQSGRTWVSEEDAWFTLGIETSGDAYLSYGAFVAAQAIQPGPVDDPSGFLESTANYQWLNPVLPPDTEPAEQEVPEENPFHVLTLRFSWDGSVQCNAAVTFLEETVGEGYDASNDYMTYVIDVSGLEKTAVFSIDLPQAWDDGKITTYADVLCLADWAAGAGNCGLAYFYPTLLPYGDLLTSICPGSVTPAETLVRSLRVPAGDAPIETFETFAEDWTASVEMIRQPMRAGVVYISITEDAEGVSEVGGPFLAASLPAATAETKHLPLAISDGTTCEQLHTGPVLWKPGAGGGGGVAFTEITQEAYDALDPPDPDAIYDITDFTW